MYSANLSGTMLNVLLSSDYITISIYCKISSMQSHFMPNTIQNAENLIESVWGQMVANSETSHENVIFLINHGKSVECIFILKVLNSNTKLELYKIFSAAELVTYIFVLSLPL